MISFIFSRKFCFGNSPLAKSNFAGFFEIRLGSKSRMKILKICDSENQVSKKNLFFQLGLDRLFHFAFSWFLKVSKKREPMLSKFSSTKFSQLLCTFFKAMYFPRKPNQFCQTHEIKKTMFF